LAQSFVIALCICDQPKKMPPHWGGMEFKKKADPENQGVHAS
jgi:hypothetical protein